jgi:hypothetical protein
MRRQIFFGLSEPTDWSREQEWNRWYSTMHQLDLSQTRGLKEYGRYLNLLPSFPPAQSKYTVLYYFDSADFVDSMIHMCVDIDQWTIAEGRHIDWHCGRGDAFCGVAAPPSAPPGAGKSYARSPTPMGLATLAERYRTCLTSPVPAVYDVQDFGRHQSRYVPPLAPRGLVMLFLSCQHPERGEELEQWARATWPGIEVFRKFAIARMDYCLIHAIENPDVLAGATTFFADLEQRCARGECFDDAVGYSYVLQQIDAQGFEPMVTADYARDPAKYPYIADGTIDAMVGMLRSAAR